MTPVGFGELVEINHVALGSHSTFFPVGRAATSSDDPFGPERALDAQIGRRIERGIVTGKHLHGPPA
jgi:hypothetical protein